MDQSRITKRKSAHVERELISLREIAELWHCDRTTVARILDRAGIQPYSLTNKRNGTKRYSKHEIDDFMNACLGKRTRSSLSR